MKKQLVTIFLALMFFAGCTGPGKNEKTSDTLSVTPAAEPDTAKQKINAGEQTIADAQEAVGDEGAEGETDGEDEEHAGPPPYPGAQRLWTYQFFGFSPDLSTVAFETTGRVDYNWVGYQFFLVNVNKNDFVGKPYRERFEDDEAPDSVKTAMRARLKVYKLPSQSGFAKYTLDPLEGKVVIRGVQHQLRLLQTGPLFELQLVEPLAKKKWVLQKDTKLPASRGSTVLAYRLKDAFVQGSKIAVMIELDTDPTEFEGVWEYYTKYMMVTGTIDAAPVAL